MLNRVVMWGMAVAVLGATPCLGEDVKVWKLSGVLPAAEAQQAATAEGEVVYAIASRQIVKYDRRTGEQLAASTGEAAHLNSGFFWQGKLYCAHSNYPRVPEHSEILVLEPATMQLSTFKDFGSYGGSLTWVVRHEGSWWCNFARYGADNGETFLARFDDNFNELGRWTYPKAVIGRLGRYSLSGGLFLEGSLLVTGHDDPLLFRLRVPASGSTLELLDTQPAPFSGQGIAADPRTGGLVGIHRARRQIVFATLQPGDGR